MSLDTSNLIASEGLSFNGSLNATSSAAAYVSDLLKHPDDLNKTAAFKQKLLRERAVIDTQLKNGVQAQISVTLQGLHSLNEAKQRVDHVADNMTRIGKISQDCKEAVVNFSKINQLSRILQNFEDTQRFVDNFRGMSRELREIQVLMQENGDFEIDATFPKLIEIHHRLSKLRDIQDDAYFHVRKSTEDVTSTIKRHFAPLNRLVEVFDGTLFDIAGCLLEILRDGDRSVIVRMAKIITYEQKQDLVPQLLNEIASSGDKNMQNLLVNSLQTHSHREPRNYPQRFFAAIEKSIAETFHNCEAHYDGDNDQLLDGLDWIFDDLALARSELVKCVPSHWNIFDKYVAFYHRQVYKLLNDMVAKEPPASILLRILDYTKEYYKNMKELGVSSVFITKKKARAINAASGTAVVSINGGTQVAAGTVTPALSAETHNQEAEEEALITNDILYPPLLDGKEDNLYDDYLTLLVTKLREWYHTFALTEKENFINRQVPPDTVGDHNWYGLEGEQVMFKLITQQIEVAVESGQGSVLSGCIEACASVLLERQQDWEKTMVDQVKIQLEDTAVDESESTVPGGLVEYLMALANDQIRAADFTEAISSQRSTQVSKKYREVIIKRLDEVCDGYISLAKKCLHSLYDIIFNDLKGPYSEIFSSSSWYKGKPARQIADTILEYSLDCGERLNALLFEQFMEDMVNGLTLHYLRALDHCSGIKVSKAVERIRLDVEIFYDLFTRDEFNVSAETVQGTFRVFEHVIASWESPQEQLMERFFALRQDFWDAPLDLFEKIIQARKDLDSKNVRQIIAQVRIEALHNQAVGGQEATFLADFLR